MTPPANRKPLTARRRQILDAIVKHQRSHGYPPSIREIAAEVGLKSPASVKAHMDVLDSAGYLRVDPTRPRAVEVRYDENSGAAVERRPVRHVPLVGDVAAGSGVLAAESVEELVPMPADLTGEGDLFMLRVRGDSMIDARHPRRRLRGVPVPEHRGERGGRGGGNPRRRGHREDSAATQRPGRAGTGQRTA